MENKGYRHEIFRFVQQIDDCVGECHGKQAVVDLEAIVKNTNYDAAHGEQQIFLAFREVDVVVEKTPITNHDGVS